MSQFPSVPKLTSSTGEAQDSAAACFIENWGILDRIGFHVF